MFNIDQIKRIQHNLGYIVDELENAIHLRRTCLKDVSSMVDNAKKELDTFTQQIINTATTLKQQTQLNLDALRQELEQVLTDQTTSLVKELSGAKTVLEKTKQAITDSNNPSQQIVCSSLAAIATHRIMGVNKRLKCPDISDIVFKPHVTHAKLFGSLLNYHSMGDFKAVYRVNHGNATSVKVEETSREKVIPKTGPYTLQTEEKVNIKLEGDKNDTYIYGSCSLHDGTILLADYHNSCVKRLSPPSSSPSDSLPLPFPPWAICNIDEQEAAVTLPTNTQVQMFSLGQPMKTTRSFKVDRTCRGLAYHGGELFITEGKTVHAYSLTGRRLRLFFGVSNNVRLFTNIRNVAVSAGGDMLFVVDWFNGLIAVDSTTGRKVWHFKTDDIVNASGVCIDGRGSVFVCGFYSHNVLQLNEDGERLGETVNTVTCPRALCFDTLRYTLVVAKDHERNELMKFKCSSK